jgi:hemolysin III
MNLLKSHKNQVPIEEWGNASLHLLGAMSSIAGLFVMSLMAIGTHNPLKWVSVLTFGVSLILMFSASTLYHFERNPQRKIKLKIFDHCAIFFLIAGTYTPFLLLTLNSTFSYTLLSVIWFTALIGTIYKCFFVHHYPKLSTLIYLVMGWLAIIIINPLFHNLAREGVYWLIAGGLCYTVGVIFYLWKRLYFSHTIWHLFVIAGCACHFWTIYRFVLPLSS